VSPLRGEKPQNWPLSKLNTGRFALRAMLPVIKFFHVCQRPYADVDRASAERFRLRALLYHKICRNNGRSDLSVDLIWPPYVIGQAIIFLSCGFFYLSSVFYLFSLPNLSGRRLDIYHTSTHGVTLVRIQNAGLKYAARGSLEMQDPKNRQKFAIWAPSYNFVGL